MRLPDAPATLRAGGRISAGMISTFHTPLPIRAAMAPRDWPQRCAPSPESLITSITCSARATGLLAEAPVRERWRGSCFSAISVMVLWFERSELRSADAHEIALARREAEPALDGTFARIRCARVAHTEVGLHAARGFAAGAHRLDHG